MFKYTSKMELLMEWILLAPNREFIVIGEHDRLSVQISQDIPGECEYANKFNFENFETINDLNNLLYDNFDSTEIF